MKILLINNIPLQAHMHSSMGRLFELLPIADLEIIFKPDNKNLKPLNETDACD